MATDAIRVAAHYQDREGRDKAEETLRETQAFNDVVEGLAAPEDVAVLQAAGLVVEALPASESAPPHAAQPAEAAPAAPDTGLVAGMARDEAAERRVSPVSPANRAARADQPDPGDEALDAYRIRLDAPITAEQRQAFADLGVDLAAFEPPDRYRTVLSGDQLRAVGMVQGVIAVDRYETEDTLDPELGQALQEDRGPKPGLMADQGADTETFDCIVHREADLEDIKERLEDQAEVDVEGTSNVRIRFQAPLDVELLTSIAAMPEVRKLSRFEAPKL